MNNNAWYECFLEALYKKYPQKAQLTEALMDLLSIEREATYRRLRGDVLFPVHEIVQIASAWNISLDEVLGITSQQIHLFKGVLQRYLNPTKDDLELMQKMIDFIDIFSVTPNAEFMEVCNSLPRSLLTGFPQLTRYYIFKWMYQYGESEQILSYSQVIPPEKIRQLASLYNKKMKKITSVSYIWDHMIFNYLVNDIKYFHSIYLITEEEKQAIKADLYAFLDYMSEVSYKSSFPETNNSVNLYISQINVDTGYSYFYSDTIKLCRIRVFIKNELTSREEYMSERFHTWMQLKKRSAIQISGVDEKRRIDFFMKQRQLIDNL